MKIFRMVWKDCTRCRAPQTRPLPEGWSYTSRKHFGITHVTPHLPGCEWGFKKVWLPDDE